MSTHKGKKVRVSKKNKYILETLRDDFGLNSQDDVITELLKSSLFKPKRKRKKISSGFSL